MLLITSCLLSPGTTVCPPCDNEMKSEAIVEHLCASEFGKESVPAASPRRQGSGARKGGGTWYPGTRASRSLSRHLGRPRQCPGQQAGCTVCLEGISPLPPKQEPGHQQGATAASVSLPIPGVPADSCSPCPEASVPLDVSVGARREGRVRGRVLLGSPVGMAGAGVLVAAWCLHLASPPALVLQHGRQLCGGLCLDISPARLPCSPGSLLAKLRSACQVQV